MKLTDVLLVTQSHREQGEINFVTTMDEFIADYCGDEATEVGDVLRRLISGAKPYSWDGFYAGTDDRVFEMRLCQSQADLLDFLGGKFNDSIEKMEARLPGTAGMHRAWDWYNNPEMFSDRAVRIVKDYALGLGSQRHAFVRDLLTAMPDFPGKRFTRATSKERLSDLIRQAETRKPLHRVAEVRQTQIGALEF